MGRKRKRKHNSSFGGSGNSELSVTMMITIILIGLMVSATLLIAMIGE